MTSVFVLGSALAAGCLWPVLTALRSTTIAVVITPQLVLMGSGALFLASILGAALRAAGGGDRSGHGVPHVTCCHPYHGKLEWT